MRVAKDCWAGENKVKLHNFIIAVTFRVCWAITPTEREEDEKDHVVVVVVGERL